MDLYCGFFSEITENPVEGGVGLYCGKIFLRSIFFQEELYPPLYTFLWGEAGPFTLESHIHVKALKMQGFPNN